ncbi:hypothetical protein WH47_02850 [Habropoda laboriosa]|uniref:Uncharacterized protein n=1 Tax=Habropoda laboriosa TaxID=597456 RepID=A0A0L7RHB2_9HYME|nr:hypothetical protein WH47_02850 [Habropoda laboriosa]
MGEETRTRKDYRKLPRSMQNGEKVFVLLSLFKSIIQADVLVTLVAHSYRQTLCYQRKSYKKHTRT